MAEERGVALVTGAARRIGRGIAKHLAKEGFAVAIHCRRSGGEAQQFAETLRKAGARAAVLEADLLDMAQAEQLVARAEAALGSVTLLVNNASVFLPDSAAAPDWAAWERHFGIHVKAPAALAASFAAALPADRSGLIVNIVDQRVWKLTPQFFSYTLSKAALFTATRTMAQALGPRIRVNAIGPGPTLANERQRPEDFRAQQEGLLLGRGPDLVEFGRTILYLWDTPSVTGQMIAIDGGQHLAWQTPDVTGMRE